MKILYFGTYDPNYSRNRVLIKGLKENGVNVSECTVGTGGIFKLVSLFFKYLSLKKDFDLMVVGFPGQEVMLLAPLLTKKPIVFDAFTSHYGGHVIDRGSVSSHSFLGRYYRWIDRVSVLRSDMALLDTQSHIGFFVNEFGLPSSRFLALPVGTDSSLFYPHPIRDGVFRVHFHGNFIPLQGTDTIIRAAALLKSENIQFQIIGRGQTYPQAQKLAKELGAHNIEFIDRVSYATLPQMIARGHISLGVFGTTAKTDLVIPNKIYEAIACERAVITADTPAVREFFLDGDTIILVKKGNPEDLAEKIKFLKDNPDIRNKIATNGHNLFKEKLTEKKIVQSLISAINERKLL